MKFNEFNIYNNAGESNCIVRSLCKIYDKSYDDVYSELSSITKELNCDSYNDIEVFETYMERHNTSLVEYGKNLKVKDLNLDNGKYIIFCYDKKDWYHMVCIIDKVLYDKNDKSLDLYTINIYKYNS